MQEGEKGGERYRVTKVSWYSVMQWCNAKSEKEELVAVQTKEGRFAGEEGRSRDESWGERVSVVEWSGNGRREAGLWRDVMRYKYIWINDLWNFPCGMCDVGSYEKNTGKRTHVR